MPGLTPEDQNFLTQHRKIVPRLRAAGWVMVVVGLLLMGPAWMWVERLHGALTSGRTQLSTVQATTEREARLLKELQQQHQALSDVLRMLLLAVAAPLVGLVFLSGLLFMGSAWEQRQYLRIIKHLEEGRRLSG